MKKTLNREQIRLLIHFQWLQQISIGDAWRAINNAYGKKTVGRQTVNDWYKTFGEEGMRLQDKARSGRPREVDREAVLRAIEANPTSTTRMLADDFECSHTEIELILHEAGIKWRKIRWVPHLLTNAQKQKRVTIATELLERQREERF